MKIGIIGTGRMGIGLGRLWGELGHEIFFGSRDAGRAETIAMAIGQGARGGSVAEAGAFGDLLLLAVPWRGLPETLARIGPLDGTIVIDCINPIAFGGQGLDVGHTDSGAERIARALPGARVVKAFNGIYYLNLDQRGRAHRQSLFHCGDDAEAKERVASLAAAIGFDPVDAGPLESARLLEPLAYLWIQLAFPLGMGTDVSIDLVRGGTSE